MKRGIPAIWAIWLLAANAAGAQSVPSNELGVTMGHWHLNTADVEESKQMFVALGGTPSPVGGFEVVEFPDVTVYLHVDASAGAPPASGGTVGTVVDHVGFGVQDIEGSMARWTARGVPVEPSERRDDQAWIITPDGLRIEILEFPDQEHPIQHHHIHYFVPRNAVPMIRAWYSEVFGATVGMRGNFQAADIPGANLTFSGSQDEPSSGTRGTVLDHIGFEVENLDTFCERLESAGLELDQSCERDPGTGQMRAFLYDPWGTYIGLTERP